MKFKIKSLDNANEDLKNKIINHLEQFGYKIKSITNANSFFRLYYTFLEDKELDPSGYFEIDYNPRLIKKIDTNMWNFTTFTKEELKFFDLLDFDLHPKQREYYIQQDITDWVGM
jgi:hypothetical protein